MIKLINYTNNNSLYTSQPTPPTENLLYLFKRLEKDSFNHTLRSQIFQEIKVLYPSHAQKFFEDDQCLTHAEEVHEKKIFANHPHSLAKLTPLANSYLQAFSRPEVLKELIQCHTAFGLAYLSEVKSVYGTKRQFFDIYRPDIAYFAKCLKNIPPDALELLPRLGMCRALQTGIIPKIFDKYEEQYSALAKQFALLPQEERIHIEESLKYGQNTLLSEQAQEVLDELIEIAEDAFKGDQEKIGGLILKKALHEIKKADSSVKTHREIELQEFV